MESVKKWDIFELTFCVENMSEPVQAGALKAAFHGEKKLWKWKAFMMAATFTRFVLCRLTKAIILIKLKLEIIS